MKTDIKNVRVKDASQLAKMVVDLATEDTENKPKKKEKKQLVKKTKPLA